MYSSKRQDIEMNYIIHTDNKGVVGSVIYADEIFDTCYATFI